MLSQLFNPMRVVIAAVLAMLIAVTAAGAPVNADTAGQTSTRNIILGGLAAAAAIVLYNNYHHKQVAANTVVGYTRDGGVVHADGRITYPDGTVLYSGTSNRQRCSYDGYGTPCGQRTYAYHGYYPNQYPCAKEHGNGPPPWAPAHGYRSHDGKCDGDDHHNNRGNDDNQGNENQGD
jgi:hypothetical protein